jgi:hypothetical protein
MGTPMPMIPICRPALVVLLAAACAASACVTDQSEGRSSFVSGMRREASRKASDDPQGQPADRSAAGPAARTERPAPDAGPNAQRPVAPIADTRVMVYQPKGDLLLILVNESHGARRTEEGRLALALGDPVRAYKILSDSQMAAMVESLRAAGYEQSASEFLPEDAQYLTAASGDIPRYQGLISVESGPVKTRVLGFRKSSEGDALGLRRYQTYTRLKALVQKWFGDSSRSEFPVGGVTIPPVKGPS